MKKLEPVITRNWKTNCAFLQVCTCLLCLFTDVEHVCPTLKMKTICESNECSDMLRAMNVIAKVLNQKWHKRISCILILPILVSPSILSGCIIPDKHSIASLYCFDACYFTKAADMHKKARQNYSMPFSKAI